MTADGHALGSVHCTSSDSSSDMPAYAQLANSGTAQPLTAVLRAIAVLQRYSCIGTALAALHTRCGTTSATAAADITTVAITAAGITAAAAVTVAADALCLSSTAMHIHGLALPAARPAVALLKYHAPAVAAVGSLCAYLLKQQGDSPRPKKGCTSPLVPTIMIITFMAGTGTCNNQQAPVSTISTAQKKCGDELCECARACTTTLLHCEAVL
eukprot:11753-Heterococcus_DN1.PRE.1